MKKIIIFAIIVVSALILFGISRFLFPFIASLFNRSPAIIGFGFTVFVGIIMLASISLYYKKHILVLISYITKKQFFKNLAVRSGCSSKNLLYLFLCTLPFFLGFISSSFVLYDKLGDQKYENGVLRKYAGWGAHECYHVYNRFGILKYIIEGPSGFDHRYYSATDYMGTKYKVWYKEDSKWDSYDYKTTYTTEYAVQNWENGSIIERKTYYGSLRELKEELREQGIFD